MNKLALLFLLAVAPVRAEANGVPQASPAVAGPLFPVELWNTLPSPSPRARVFLSQRLPSLDLARVRELTPAAAEAAFGLAADRRLTLVDLFTDEGLTGEKIYFVDGATLVHLDGVFQLPILYPAIGTDGRGDPFRILALVMGAGRVEVLFDRAPFSYQTPWFPNYYFTAEERVTQTIRAPGAMDMSGFSVDFGFMKPRVQTIDVVGPRTARVATTVSTRDIELLPIRRGARRP